MGELENPSKFKKNRLLWDMRAHEFVSGFFLGGDSENHNILTEDGKQFQFIHPCLHLGGDTLPQGIKPLIPVLFLAYFLEAASPKKYVLDSNLLLLVEKPSPWCKAPWPSQVWGPEIRNDVMALCPASCDVAGG